MNGSALGRNESGRPAPEHRMRAALGLMRRIPDPAPQHIADVYRGRGSMRALLARRFPHAEIEAFDLEGERGHDLSVGRKFDLICSNGSWEMVSSLRRVLLILLGTPTAGGVA